jgi:hypothetical protein
VFFPVVDELNTMSIEVVNDLDIGYKIVVAELAEGFRALTCIFCRYLIGFRKNNRAFKGLAVPFVVNAFDSPFIPQPIFTKLRILQ